MNKLRPRNLFILLTLVLLGNSVQAENKDNIQATTHTYHLGQSIIKVTEYVGNITGGLVYFHPHDSEQISIQAVKEVIAKHGGRAFVINNKGERIVSFNIADTTYLFDPNRIFTPDGVEATLKKYGPYSDTAKQEVIQFSKWLSGLMSTGRVLAIHNNRDTTYNVLSYKGKDGKPIAGIKALYINQNKDPGNFVYTTNMGLYMAAKNSGLNTVLQAQDIEDDGSYSVYAMRQGLDYSNVETKIGDLNDDVALIAFVNRYYNYADMTGTTWETLKKGDLIDLVATSSAYDESHIKTITKALTDLGFRVSSRFAQQKDDPLWYSNTDAERLKQLYEALSASDSKAVWGIRGGSGTTNFLTSMIGLEPPTTKKPMIGFSDVTGVHLFLNNKWNWPSIHGVLAECNKEVAAAECSGVNTSTSIDTVTELLTGKVSTLRYKGLQPLNTAATNTTHLSTTLIGGNLSLLSVSIGTPLQPTQRPFTLLIEAIGNNQHQLERMMDQISYSENMKYVQAVVLGEFLKSDKGDDKHNTELNNLVLQRFADKLEIPVFRWQQFGHGAVNQPLPLNTAANISNDGNEFTLTVQVR